jgi:hypothetical protein
MKFTVTLSLLAVFAFTACEIDEPPRRTGQRPAVRPATTTAAQQAAAQYPPQPQPFPSDVAPTQTAPPTDPAAATTATTTTGAATAPTTTTSTTSTGAAAKSDPPYGIPVPGKPGFVTSPYSPDKITDVRGYAPGTEVKDPYTGKIFLVP